MAWSALNPSHDRLFKTAAAGLSEFKEARGEVYLQVMQPVFVFGLEALFLSLACSVDVPHCCEAAGFETVSDMLTVSGRSAARLAYRLRVFNNNLSDFVEAGEIDGDPFLRKLGVNSHTKLVIEAKRVGSDVRRSKLDAQMWRSVEPHRTPQ